MHLCYNTSPNQYDAIIIALVVFNNGVKHWGNPLAAHCNAEIYHDVISTGQQI